MNLAGCEFTERELLERVMRSMEGKRRGGYMNQRWILVKSVFGCGSGVAYALCREFGLDPDEELKP